MKKLFLAALISILASPNAASQSKNSEPIFYLDRKAVQEHIWYRVPTVYVCVGSILTETRVKKAMSAWKRLGYILNGPIMKSTIPECLVYDSSPGNILIGSNTARVPADNAAVTRTWYNKYTDEIVSAFIEIKPKWNTRERVVEHELGHALGWDHCNKRYHLMHSIHELGGWDTSGLRNKQKISYIKREFSSLEEKVYID
jgi:hypothetical protein